MNKFLNGLMVLAASVGFISSASAADVTECIIVDAQGTVKGLEADYWRKGASFRIVSEQEPVTYDYVVTEVAFAREKYDQTIKKFYTAPTKKLPYTFRTPVENVEVTSAPTGPTGKPVYQFQINFTDKATQSLNATLVARCEYWM